MKEFNRKKLLEDMEAGLASIEIRLINEFQTKNVSENTLRSYVSLWNKMSGRHTKYNYRVTVIGDYAHLVKFHTGIFDECLKINLLEYISQQQYDLAKMECQDFLNNLKSKIKDLEYLAKHYSPKPETEQIEGMGEEIDRNYDSENIGI